MDTLKKPVSIGFASGLASALVFAFFISSAPALAGVGMIAAAVLNKDTLLSALREGQYFVIAAYAGGGMLGGIAAMVLAWIARPALNVIF
jgi:hypothetical protein